jgi:dinuclear metal center YbgI/SA1388 family protein
MTTVRKLSAWLFGFAPPRLAEPWDNVGLLLGDWTSAVERVMTCLTVTGRTSEEAIQERVDLIVSHHPVLFRGAKKVVAGRHEDGMLWSLARAGISIYSPHTAFDNTAGGINDGLAARLGLKDVQPLREGTPVETFKIVVFTPESDLPAVLSAAFEVGAGKIGAYEECSFAIPGIGTFFGSEHSNPTVGQAGRRESVAEQRVEFVCPAGDLALVLASIREAHSYEEPAIDVYPLRGNAGGQGAGRVGDRSGVTILKAFAAEVAGVLGAPAVQFVGDGDRPIARVAIVCGAGDDFLPDAVDAGADVLLTGESRYHRAIEAESRKIGLVVAGHHATERPGVEDLAARIASAFPDLTVWASRSERDPYQNA